jgi:predicted alpha/beta-hydrolase family hydrolase
MTSPFLETATRLLVERGLRVARFEFPYMAARRDGGKRRPPPKAERLMDDYRQMVATLAAEVPPGGTLLIGGKSMGGRVASLIADDCFAQGSIAGLVCLGYPFHPIGKPDQLRTSHLETLRCPALIVQGERDPLGSRAEVEASRLSPSIRLHWAGDGDHDLGPRGGGGYTRSANLAAAAEAVAGFARDLAAQK